MGVPDPEKEEGEEEGGETGGRQRGERGKLED